MLPLPRPSSLTPGGGVGDIIGDIDDIIGVMPGFVFVVVVDVIVVVVGPGPPTLGVMAPSGDLMPGCSGDCSIS